MSKRPDTPWIDDYYPTIVEKRIWRARDLFRKFSRMPETESDQGIMVNTSWPGLLITDAPSPGVIPGSSDPLYLLAFDS